MVVRRVEVLVDLLKVDVARDLLRCTEVGDNVKKLFILVKKVFFRIKLKSAEVQSFDAPEKDDKSYVVKEDNGEYESVYCLNTNLFVFFWVLHDFVVFFLLWFCCFLLCSFSVFFVFCVPICFLTLVGKKGYFLWNYFIFTPNTICLLFLYICNDYLLFETIQRNEA